ncbi:MAG: hypothetical protein R3F11_18045 [Verrucomicrobiales bacterium]
MTNGSKCRLHLPGGSTIDLSAGSALRVIRCACVGFGVAASVSALSGLRTMALQKPLRQAEAARRRLRATELWSPFALSFELAEGEAHFSPSELIGRQEYFVRAGQDAYCFAGAEAFFDARGESRALSGRLHQFSGKRLLPLPAAPEDGSSSAPRWRWLEIAEARVTEIDLKRGTVTLDGIPELDAETPDRFGMVMASGVCDQHGSVFRSIRRFRHGATQVGTHLTDWLLDLMPGDRALIFAKQEAR